MKERIAVSHIDTLLNSYKNENYDFNKLNDNFHVDLPRVKKSQVKLIVFAIFPEENHLSTGNGLKKTIQMVDDFYQLIDNCEDLEVATDYEDIERINTEGNIASILAIEGAKSIFNISALRVFYRLGVRLITLTWNHRNHIADGVAEQTDGGLTRTGKEFVREMNKLNIGIDVSHLNSAGFWDVSKITTSPIVASHSNAKSLCNHPRNLTDEQLQAIADSGGIVGINFCPLFLTENRAASIDDVFCHIDYIKNLIGIEYIGLGTDYDGIRSAPAGLEDIGKLYKLKDIMIKKGYEEEEIEAIFYDNWSRVLEKILDK